MASATQSELVGWFMLADAHADITGQLIAAGHVLAAAYQSCDNDSSPNLPAVIAAIEHASPSLSWPLLGVALSSVASPSNLDRATAPDSPLRSGYVFGADNCNQDSARRHCRALVCHGMRRAVV